MPQELASMKNVIAVIDYSVNKSLSLKKIFMN